MSFKGCPHNYDSLGDKIVFKFPGIEEKLAQVYKRIVFQ